jgi:predicted dehydrogenase
MKKIKWGVIGAGGIADRKTIPGMLQAANSELVHVMDVKNAAAIADKHGVPRCSDRVEDLLADEEVDAVYIATPVMYHFEQIRAAAEAGKHILCEKPLTMTSEQAHEAVALCDANGVKLQEGYMMRFHGAHQKIKELIDAGKLGTLTYMRAQLSCWYPPIEGAWRQDPARGGGGALMDMATHLFDLLEYFAGPVAKVAAVTGSLVHDYESEDSSCTLLHFANGASATVDCFFNLPDEASRTRLEVYGSRGSILTEGTIGQGDGGTAEGIFVAGDAGYDAAQNKDEAAGFHAIEFDKVNMYAAEVEYLADCILSDKPVEVNNGSNAIHILQLTEKAYASARTVTFQEV